MYIKIKGTGNRQWWLFETNGYLQYTMAKQEFTTYEEIQNIDKQIKTDHVILSENVQIHNFSSGPYSAFVITFPNIKEERVTVLFDTFAYVCNNNGKTVEKISN